MAIQHPQQQLHSISSSSKPLSDTKFEVPHTVCIPALSPYHSSPKCTLVADTLLAGPAENTELLMMVFTPSTKKIHVSPTENSNKFFTDSV